MSMTSPVSISSRKKVRIKGQPLFSSLIEKAVLKLLSSLSLGEVRVTAPDGRSFKFGETANREISADLKIRNPNAYRAILKGSDIALAESYMKGEWSTSDLTKLLKVAAINLDHWDRSGRLKTVRKIIDRIALFKQRNSKSGSKKNISYHYDLGNDFYRLWLDPSMTYSSALFEDGTTSLQTAQNNKYAKIAEVAGIESGHKILEVGCGWGGFADHVTSEFDVQIDGITISQRQLDYAKSRPLQTGPNKKADFHFKDYRDQEGQYDAIVSIEMFEAVGEENWNSYFQMLARNLKPNAAASIQTILIDDTRYKDYRNEMDFIQKYIFPGGFLPSQSAFIQAAERNGLKAELSVAFGNDYATTLKYWREEFLKKWQSIHEMGMDRKFKHLWEFYLCYCEAGFSLGHIDVGIFKVTKA